MRPGTAGIGLSQKEIGTGWGMVSLGSTNDGEVQI